MGWDTGLCPDGSLHEFLMEIFAGGGVTENCSRREPCPQRIISAENRLRCHEITEKGNKKSFPLSSHAVFRAAAERGGETADRLVRRPPDILLPLLVLLDRPDRHTGGLCQFTLAHACLFPQSF